MHRIDRRQAAGPDRPRDGGRQRARPAMHMHDGVLLRQARQQRAKRLAREPVPGALQHGFCTRGGAQQIGLAQTNHLDAGVVKALIDRLGGGEEDRLDAASMKPQRAVYGDFGLPAGDGGVIGADHHGERLGGCGHGGALRELGGGGKEQRGR